MRWYAAAGAAEFTCMETCRNPVWETLQADTVLLFCSDCTVSASLALLGYSFCRCMQADLCSILQTVALIKSWTRLNSTSFHFSTTKCVPVHFLNKLRFTLTFRILWLARPLINNILDSPTQYLANATIGTSLACQMREEYMFEKNYFRNLDLKGGKYWRYVISHATYACF